MRRPVIFPVATLSAPGLSKAVCEIYRHFQNDAPANVGGLRRPPVQRVRDDTERWGDGVRHAVSFGRQLGGECRRVTGQFV